MSAGYLRGSMLTVAGAVLRRPWLWVAALVTVARLARPGWWRRRPHLPLPDDRLWRFRMETVYGRSDADPEMDDILAYLDWCRREAGRRGTRTSGALQGDAHRDPGRGAIRDGPFVDGASEDREPTASSQRTGASRRTGTAKFSR